MFPRIRFPLGLQAKVRHQKKYVNNRYQGRRGCGRNRELGIDAYTPLPLRIKQATSENLLRSPGNSTWHAVVTGMGRRPNGGAYMKICRGFTVLDRRDSVGKSQTLPKPLSTHACSTVPLLRPLTLGMTYRGGAL